MAEDEGLFAALEERLQVAEKLLKRCENLGTHVEGKQKLYKKIKAEFSFLSSVSNNFWLQNKAKVIRRSRTLKFAIISVIINVNYYNNYIMSIKLNAYFSYFIYSFVC